MSVCVCASSLGLNQSVSGQEVCRYLLSVLTWVGRRGGES